jgi:hypothetical protein
MIDEFLIYLSLTLVAGLIVFLIVYVVHQCRTTIRHPQPVRIIFKDPFGLASGFDYTLNPNYPRKRSFGNMNFVTETGRETPPEHRKFELEDGKQGDTLVVTWKFRDGSHVAATTALPISSVSSVTVTLTKTKTVSFENRGSRRESAVAQISMLDASRVTSMNTLRQVTVLTVTFVIVGIGLLVAGTVITLQTRSFIASAIATDGKVVGLEPSNSGTRNKTTYFTVFAFKDAAGQTHTIRTTSSQNPPPFQVGSEITVLYPVGLPESARIKSFSTLWLIPTFFFVIGFGLAGIGALPLHAARKTYGGE